MTERLEAACFVALLGATACTDTHARTAEAAARAVTSVTPEVALTNASPAETADGDALAVHASAPRERPPILTDLAVPGFETAIVSFPPSAPLPQPVLIATHGAGDTPTEMCELWRGILGDRGVVLCPAGPRMRAHEEGRYYPDHHALERINFAALAALRERYADLVDTERAVYTGYSQGATMGALMIPPYGAECPRLVLVEGGFADWSMERATTFKKMGGERALFVCGRQQCKDGAERSAAWLRSAGVPARVVSHVGEGHVIRVALVAAPELDWLLEGDPRWAPRE
ncbi:MAG TPA: hypothetical protein VHC69_05455 [Polyangiaceae bacterium]|nr:hypothetical protein [Polyangiaceae bacterium]